jgi:hypothetical protein
MSESAVRAFAEARRFAAATRERWLALAPADRDALLEIAERLRLGENQFRDLLDDLTAIAARHGVALGAVARGQEMAAVLARPLGRNEAIKAVKQVLRGLRYPQLERAAERLAALGKQLQLPAGVCIELPEQLEGEHLAVTLRARSAAELRAQARAVTQALQGDALDEMFAVLEGRW